MRSRSAIRGPPTSRLCCSGRPASDYQLELVAFVLAAVLFTASRRWVAEQGATSLASLVDQALSTIEPLLAALEYCT